ncbi:MAG TPA: pitrilysin family protein, partial [Bryobacteraceae bacterium]|nr:pitrilysin family protein [Bryobacteraceae bacterium]
FPPMNKITVPEPVRFQLPNGMTVFLVEDHELPMISVSALVRTGSRWEPADKVGLASITGTVMRTGGTASRPGDQLDEELDRLGAIVETGIGQDSGGATVSVLKEDIDTGLTILADILQNPAFPEDKITLAKIRMRESVARRNDDPGEIASREFRRILFGKDSPYARVPEYATIDSITRDDLVAFHRQFFQPENVILGVWGDFDAAEMRAKIENTLGKWARGGRPQPPVPDIDPAARNRAGIYAINKDDVNQSRVLMGFIGGKRNDPDYYALTVANTILGGGFSSRLMNHVRADQGLAYSVGSSWAAGWDRPGYFVASGATKSETTVKIINAIKAEIQKLAEDVTDDELARAKDAILKGFAFEFDSTGEIVRRLMTYEYFGYPSDYLQRYRDNIEKVTKADVLRVAKQYLKTDNLAILVLGREKDFDQPLTALGEVTPIDISIPAPAQTPLAAATPEAEKKGRALLAAARDAMGGAAVMSVKDYTETGSMNISLGENEIAMQRETTQSLTGKVLNKMQTPMGEMVQGYDGQVAWMQTPQGTRELPASQKEEFDNSLFRETLWLLQNFDSGSLTVQALGQSEADGKPAEGVAVTDPERKRQVKLYLDAATKLPVKKVYTAAFMGPPGEIEEIYSDYREVSGVKLPFKTQVFQNGQKRAEQTTTELKINPGVPNSAYQKP